MRLKPVVPPLPVPFPIFKPQRWNPKPARGAGVTNSPKIQLFNGFLNFVKNIKHSAIKFR